MFSVSVSLSRCSLYAQYELLTDTVAFFPQLDFPGHDEALSPAPAQLEDRTADSDLSDRLATLSIFLVQLSNEVKIFLRAMGYKSA